MTKETDLTDTQLSDDTDIQDAALYRDIVQNCADAVVVVSAEHQEITYLNKAAQAMFGRSNQAVIGKPLHILIPDRFRSNHFSLAASFRDSHDPARFMDNREVPIQGLRADGVEFPVSVSILKSYKGSDTALVAIVRDITEQKKLEDDLVKLASTDPLTGIYNRRTFLRRAEEECARAGRYGHPMTFAMIDIDHFKAINDTYGHAVGDRAICHVVNILSSGLRKPDILGRWGGEEFALILPETAQEPGLITAQRLKQCVENSPITCETEKSETIQLTVSIGLSGYNKDKEPLEALINRADQALYHAKRTGRNKVCAISDLAEQKNDSDAA